MLRRVEETSCAFLFKVSVNPDPVVKILEMKFWSSTLYRKKGSLGSIMKHRVLYSTPKNLLC